MTQPQQETRLIHCYDMPSFVSEIEKAVKQGFSLDFKKNEHYPVQIGYQFVTTMIKEQVQDDKNEVTVKLEIDTTAVQEIVNEAMEQVKALQDGSATPVEVSKIERVVQSTTEELQAAVGASKKAGRPAKGK